MLFTYSLHRKAVTREVSENILPFVVAHGFPASGWFPSTRGRGAAVAGDFRRFCAGGIRGTLTSKNWGWGGLAKQILPLVPISLVEKSAAAYYSYMSKVLRSSPLEAKKPKNPHPSCRGRLSDAFARCLAEAESAALVESGAWDWARNCKVVVREPALLSMLSFLSYCRFSSFASISFAHITLFELGIAQTTFPSVTDARLCFAQAPWYTSEIHMQISTKISWRHEEDVYNVSHTHQSQTPCLTQPGAPTTPNPAQRAKAQPNPRPNTAQRAHQRVHSHFF